MSRPSIVIQSRPPRVEYVTRFSLTKKKIRPFNDKQTQDTTTDVSTATFESERPISPGQISTNPIFALSHSDAYKILSNTNENKFSQLSTKTKDDPIQKEKNLAYRFRNWYNQLSLNGKLLCGSIVAILVISLLMVVIIPPVCLFVIYRSTSRSSFTLTNVSSCSTSTCIGQETPYQSSIVTALYPFDGNTNDQSGYETGIAFGSPVPTFAQNAYVGQSLILTSTSQDYVKIPNIDFSWKSFTIQTWLMPISVTGTVDYGIFSQCDLNSKCLSLSLRNLRFVLSFDSMNADNDTLTGSTLVNFSGYVHVTVAYDAVLFQQQIYVDGLIDAVSSGMVYPFQGNSLGATTTIGSSSSYAYGTTYFNGRVDQFTITAGVARNACEIYNDASLVTYYPFDTTGTYNDYSVYICNGIASGTTTTSSGRVHQALSFASPTSYFVSQCFPKMRAADNAFSFSLWVNPTSTTSGGTLIHISSNPDGSGTCYDHLAFKSTGALIFQWMIPSTSVSSAQGPVIASSTWTHIGIVYSKENGMRLYINGQFSTSSPNLANLVLYDTGIPLYIILGNMSPLGSAATFTCSVGTISTVSGPYSGSIDEFRLYNRELNSQELCVLANP